jgi:X-Pro dipeptidyl-peptidase (S15 family)
VQNSLSLRAGRAYDARVRGPNRKFRSRPFSVSHGPTAFREVGGGNHIVQPKHENRALLRGGGANGSPREGTSYGGLRIPAPGAGKKGLEAVIVRPNEPGPHPLALVNHGAPRGGRDRRKMTPSEMLPEAREFARRGWTTVIVMCRGCGDSGGNFVEDARGCSRTTIGRPV